MLRGAVGTELQNWTFGYRNPLKLQRSEAVLDGSSSNLFLKISYCGKCGTSQYEGEIVNKIWPYLKI